MRLNRERLQKFTGSPREAERHGKHDGDQADGARTPNDLTRRACEFFDLPFFGQVFFVKETDDRRS
jgi:hypothetical protein